MVARNYTVAVSWCTSKGMYHSTLPWDHLDTDVSCREPRKIHSFTLVVVLPSYSVGGVTITLWVDWACQLTNRPYSEENRIKHPFIIINTSALNNDHRCEVRRASHNTTESDPSNKCLPSFSKPQGRMITLSARYAKARDHLPTRRTSLRVERPRPITPSFSPASLPERTNTRTSSPPLTLFARFLACAATPARSYSTPETLIPILSKWCSSFISLTLPDAARSALDGTHPRFTQVPPTSLPENTAVFNPVRVSQVKKKKAINVSF